VIIQGVTGALFASSLAGIGAALEGKSPSDIEATTGNPYNIALGALLGIAGSYANATRLGKLILTGVALGGGGSAAVTAFRQGKFAAAVYYATLALGGAFLVNAASVIRSSESAPRLVIGGGNAPGFPTVPEGSFSLNIEPSAQPSVVGDASTLPFAPDTFSEIYYERVPYGAFTGDNAQAISEAAAVLQPGGRLIIVTGSGVSQSEVIALMNGAGLTNIQPSQGPGRLGAVTITATK
jgi:SAM-dependent methyltransferase